MKRIVSKIPTSNIALASTAQTDKFYGVNVANSNRKAFNGRGFVSAKSYASGENDPSKFFVGSLCELTTGNTWSHLDRQATLVDYLAFLDQEGNEVFEFDKIETLIAWIGEYGR